MSWHLPRHYRLNTMHNAVSMALIYSVGAVLLPSIAQSAVVGQAVVTSAPHQPLTASMMVTDIDATDFSATLAGRVIYQEIGLTPIDSMSVRFVPTSKNSGHLLVTTTQPITMPFADMVLTLNNNGQRDVIPKTLLMPLAGQKNVRPIVPMMASQPSAALIAHAQPLLVKHTLPPPLIDNGQLQASPNSTRAIYTASATSTLPRTPLSVIRRSVMPPLPSSQINDTKPQYVAPVLLADAIKQSKVTSDALKIQVKRRLKNSDDNQTVAKNTSTIAAKNFDKNQTRNTISNETVLVVSNQPPPELHNNKPNSATLLTPNDRSSQTAKQYTVQHQDSLWLIAQQVAEQNNLDTQRVMADIRTRNSHAFVDSVSYRLKPTTKLDLSHYDTVPAQDTFQTAIRNKKQQYLQSIKADARIATTQSTTLQIKASLDQQKTLISNETRIKIQRVVNARENKVSLASETARVQKSKSDQVEPVQNTILKNQNTAIKI